MSVTPSRAETDALDRVVAMACERYTGEGPVFTAAIVKDERMIALEHNEVATACDPSRHAEIVAMARASEALGGSDLSGATLIASMQPCEMCLAAMRWAGIDRLIFAMTQEEAPAFFQFPKLGIDDYARASDGAFDWVGGVQMDAVRHIYESAG
ncbi:nucleoside deaminase [Roseivivax sp. THAF197b]|uniref:nucleoside deaminase n=1 Tax=Roseivivax sp. THAF197b TaxID=2588299 RepID=UPI0012678FB3|nr:nucleoside deaminase [Roseivivax sp. THAF197b]QFS84420.1 Guanine deaminase [Roseivivax sp. THAF197b]